MRQQDCLCLPQEAAERLGISVDDVLDLIAAGELAAVMYMDDDRWFIERDSVDRMARRARRRGARPDGNVHRRAAISQLLRRCFDAIS